MRSTINSEEKEKVMYAKACEFVRQEIPMTGFVRARSAKEILLTNWNIVKTCRH